MSTPETLSPEMAAYVVKRYVGEKARQRKQYLDNCYWKGLNSRGRYMRVSPYYEDAGADLFWYAGFDGLSLEEAVILHDSKLGRGA